MDTIPWQNTYLATLSAVGTWQNDCSTVTARRKLTCFFLLCSCHDPTLSIRVKLVAKFSLPTVWLYPCPSLRSACYDLGYFREVLPSMYLMSTTSSRIANSAKVNTVLCLFAHPLCTWLSLYVICCHRKCIIWCVLASRLACEAALFDFAYAQYL